MNFTKTIPFRFLTLSLGLAVLIVLLQWTFPIVIHSSIWTIYFFLVGLSFLVGFLSATLLKALPENFFAISVLAMIMRLIASLIFIGILVWPSMEGVILFLANFFVLFLCYLVFDIYAFLSNLRPISK